ncbi:tRNA 5-methoxyuridine(34)/uridine 5-oxyacetic acid(34) synthase CmoB [Thorsellia kenyensis]|uniref:tRNA U34 carboxymethyltransferase n=1 Tax=Thorsellia kenyensis TaxID=1549888 RepID=A0ABV6CBV3_9GAMM
MVDEAFKELYQELTNSHLIHWLDTLPKQLSDWSKDCAASHPSTPKHRWYKSITHLPVIQSELIELKDKFKVQSTEKLTIGEKQGAIHQLKQLMPWRKGPFDIHDIFIDTEWRSDFKWDRVKNHITSLEGRWVLDVGCGSGYHLWRMLGEGAKAVIGIDPTELFLCQFLAIKKLINQKLPAYYVPLGIENLPALEGFDTVFSMGVLYHRRSPLDHLLDLKNQLKPGGELVLETLVIEGDESQVLVPVDRYAMMSNVYFFPSIKAITLWLSKMGYVNIRVVDVNKTSFEEQRKTEWMQNESLSDFLDNQNPSLTKEGYPAPLRAVFIANKP